MCWDKETLESMKHNMTEEEKQMWEKMTECCCTDMTDEEKQTWMKDRHKMMHHMKECGGPMMGMMRGKGEKFMPMDMCNEMMSTIRQSHRVATLATPEVQGLFEDWVEQIEQEILDYLKDKDTVEINDLTSKFKISKDSAYYFLTKLAQKEKLKLNVKKEK
jgi:hypothetical protein